MKADFGFKSRQKCDHPLTVKCKVSMSTISMVSFKPSLVICVFCVKIEIKGKNQWHPVYAKYIFISQWFCCYI